MKRLKILYLESFYGGSHKDFADGIVKNSFHEISLYTLPARFWKWRMRGAALYFFEKIRDFEKYDLIFTSSMISVSDLKMLLGEECPPVITYFHESQITYPIAPGEKADLQYVFTDITSCLASDLIIFNSEFHYNKFIEDTYAFLKRLPDSKPLWAIDDIKKKSEVIYPGCSFGPEIIKKQENKIPLIIWNHRWEFDKNPELFFKAIFHIKDKGYKFNLAVLGENYTKAPEIFSTAKDKLSDHIIYFGYIETKEEYYNVLKQGDIVISTSNQENFGISVIEAIRFGAEPLLPNRLSYPELIAPEYHEKYIYNSESELFSKLENLIKNNKKNLVFFEKYSDYSWQKKISEYDNIFERSLKK